MKKNYTFFYLVENIENPVCELISDEFFDTTLETGYRDIFYYMDGHLAEIRQNVVEKIFQYSDDILNNR